jgi:hypothetical protein
MAKPFLLVDESPSTPALVIGMTTALPDFRLAFLINKNLNASFIRELDDYTQHHQNETSYWALFSFLDPVFRSNWFLLQNRAYGFVISPRGRTPKGALGETSPAAGPMVPGSLETPPEPRYLLSSQSRFDYFLILLPPPRPKLQTQILKQLRLVSGVSFVTAIELKEKELKSLNLDAYYDN